MGLIFNGNGDVIRAVDGSLTVEGLDIGGSTNIEAGIGTFSGNLTVGGVLTYEDVKNVDSVGVVTARAGINLTGGNITLGDSGGNSDDKLVFGADGDLKIFHNGTNNYIDVAAGSGHLYVRPKNNFYIQDYTNGEVWIAGILNGGTYLYHNGNLKAETTADGFQVTDGYLDLNNTSGSGASLRCNSAGTFYAGNAAQGDLAIYVQDNTNNSIILQANTGEKYLEANMGGSVDVYHHGTKKLETTSTGVSVTGHVFASSNVYSDKLVSTTQSNSHSMYINARNAVGTEATLIKGTIGGAVELNYNTYKKLETLTNGIRVTGQVDVNGGGISLEDNRTVYLGTGDDFEITHRSSDESAVIKNVNDTGWLRILSGDSNSSGILLKNRDDDVTYLRAKNEQGVELFYTNSVKFETKSNGVAVAGQVDCTGGGVLVDDNYSFSAGTGGDLLLYHNGSNSYLSNSTGNLMITGNNSDKIHIRAHASKQEIVCFPSGAVQLFYNDAKKFETTSSGASVTGALNAAGATFGDYIVETNRTSGSSKGFYAKRGGVTCSVLSNHGTGPEGKMELYNNGTMNYSAHGTAGTLALNGYIRFGISNGAGNQLDDYEEGSWTPNVSVWMGNSPGSGGTPTVSSVNGKYVKIGKLVTCYCSINFSAGTSAGTSGYHYITGLPFSGANYNGAGNGGYGGGSINNQQQTGGCYVENSGVYGYPSSSTISQGTWYFNFHYFTDS